MREVFGFVGYVKRSGLFLRGLDENAAPFSAIRLLSQVIFRSLPLVIE